MKNEKINKEKNLLQKKIGKNRLSMSEIKTNNLCDFSFEKEKIKKSSNKYNLII